MKKIIAGVAALLALSTLATPVLAAEAARGISQAACTARAGHLRHVMKSWATRNGASVKYDPQGSSES